MQSGSTAINTIRIYNPIKQGQDHDPKGLFIRQWCPELAQVPDVYLHEPWKMDHASAERVGCVIGVHYPAPIVDPTLAAREAKDRIWDIRRAAGFDRLADGIQDCLLVRVETDAEIGSEKFPWVGFI